MLGANGQTVNWESLGEKNSIVYLNTGYDFGLTSQIGFGYSLASQKPIMISTDLSIPMGETLFDDFIYRLGGQMLVLEKNALQFITKFNGELKRHQTNLVKMTNLGMELSTSFGYYKPRWHLAAEIGYDFLALTQLTHAEILGENYSGITDGWYSATGGNFFYGFQGSKTIGESLELNLRLGSTKAQFDHMNPLLPYYAQLGLVYQFAGRNR